LGAISSVFLLSGRVDILLLVLFENNLKICEVLDSKTATYQVLETIFQILTAS
jgi:hypothetical protein